MSLFNRSKPEEANELVEVTEQLIKLGQELQRTTERLEVQVNKLKQRAEEQHYAENDS